MITGKLNPFDLQEALAGKPVLLRDGRKAYVRYHETELPVYESNRLVGYTYEGGSTTWSLEGEYLPSLGEHGLDIIGMYPETRIINGFEVPAPETDPLDHDATYYTPNILRSCLYDSTTWDDEDDTGSDSRWLSRGLVFLCKEDAIATAKAMLGIDPYNEDES